jgi:hypothetical protein
MCHFIKIDLNCFHWWKKSIDLIMKFLFILLFVFFIFTLQHESRGLPPGIPIERIHYQNVTKDEFFKRFVKPPGKRL